MSMKVDCPRGATKRGDDDELVAATPNGKCDHAARHVTPGDLTDDRSDCERPGYKAAPSP